MNEDEALWRDVVQTTRDMYAARRRFLTSSSDISAAIAQALNDVSERSIALQLLLDRSQEEKRRRFGDLVRLSSVRHSDIHLCREVIASIEREWREAHLLEYVLPLLETGGHEEYQSLAELLRFLDSPLLQTLARKAFQSEDEDVREVGSDFFLQPAPAELIEFLHDVRKFAPDSPVRQINMLSETFKRRVLDHASETPCNLTAIEQVELTLAEDYSGGPSRIQLVLKQSNILVADVFNFCEGEDIPIYITEAFPGLTPEEWTACMRIATLMIGLISSNSIPQDNLFT